MSNLLVAGISTDVGKTVVSAILTTLLDADYWKPVQCGQFDTLAIEKWLSKERILPAVYSLSAPLSPHHAARLEGITIDLNTIKPPKTNRLMVIEGAGGILVPLTQHNLTLDLFETWKCEWVVVVKQQLGAINHTLLTIEVLKQHHIPIKGLIFNGERNFDSESVILEKTQVPCLGHLLPEEKLDQQTIQRYAKKWQPHFQ